MSTPIWNLDQLLRTLEPVLNTGAWAFTTVPSGMDLRSLDPIATMRESEGTTVVVAVDMAERLGMPILFRAAWITLTVQSDLQAVGLTAAFAGALARADISCNVIAGAHHDHLFVPVDAAQRAMAVLRQLQQGRA